MGSESGWAEEGAGDNAEGPLGTTSGAGEAEGGALEAKGDTGEAEAVGRSAEKGSR